jgi:hypothetical protein
MIFKTRKNIKKQFDTVYNLGIKNLIVSGCSFTYNNHEDVAVAWPYYLKDLGGFDTVFDCSLPGAGNHHISNALIWGLESDRPDPSKSLVVVMWSGCDRDDCILPKSIVNNKYPFLFSYSDTVYTGITGGQSARASGNGSANLKNLGLDKTPESRAIENYLYFLNTWHYLKNSQYKFVFLKFLNTEYPSRTKHFDIRPYLPKFAQKNLDQMITDITDPYSYALKNDLLWTDDFHPSPDGHLLWTKDVLLPELKTIFI